MNYYEALSFLESTNVFGSKLGLDNISYLLELLDNPQKKVKAIHVAGTNGKGSTCAFLSNILVEAGYRTGLYISPSLEDINDRISINNKYISDEDFCDLAEIVKCAIDKMISDGYAHPTEFEVVTAMAFVYFEREKVDYVVLEVGLGGRLDATNICAPILTAITSISFDHTDYLGDTLSKIAFEKAGIIKKDVPLVLYDQEQEIVDVIVDVAKEKKSKVYLNSDIICRIIEKNIAYQIVSIQYKEKTLQAKSHLVGNHQCENLATALMLLEVLQEREDLFIKHEHIVNGIEKTKWPGRFEYIEHNPIVILDGAHNLDGAIMLHNTLGERAKNKSITLVFGILADKDIENVVKTFRDNISKVIITVPNSPRAEKPEKVAAEFDKYGIDCTIKKDIKEAVELGLKSKSEILLIAGSLYLIGDVRKILKEKGIIK